MKWETGGVVQVNQSSYSRKLVVHRRQPDDRRSHRTDRKPPGKQAPKHQALG